MTPVEQNAYGLDNSIVDPGSEDLVRVFATITDYEGVAIPNVAVIVADKFEDILSGASVIIYGKWDLTDENGYMEVLMPKDTPLYFFGYLQDEQVCYPDLNKRDTLFLDGVLGFEELGSIADDTELIESEDIRLDKTSYSLTGRFLNCDGLPIQNGTVEVEVSYLNVYNVKIPSKFETSAFDSNGDFSIDFEYCSRDEVEIDLKARNQEGFGADLSYMVSSSDLSADLGVLEACENFNWYSSFLNLSVGNDYSFENIEFRNPALEFPFSYFGDFGVHPDMNPVLFVTDELKLGECLIGMKLDFISDPSPYGFSSTTQSGELVADVTEIENGVIKATFSGEVETNELGIQAVTGDFTINYE